jgi:hypothetical protein
MSVLLVRRVSVLGVGVLVVGQAVETRPQLVAPMEVELFGQDSGSFVAHANSLSAL